MRTGLKVVECRSCKARIVFLRTEGGSNIPVDAETVQEGDEKLDRSRHVVHFQTCPDANKFRKARPSR